MQICDILDVTLAELELLASTGKKVEAKFSEEQEQFLVKNRGYLAYLFLLFDGQTPTQIGEKFKLTQRSTDKYLIGLERQELIRVTGSQKIRTTFKDFPIFGDGPLGRAYFLSLIESGNRFFIDRIHQDIAMKRANQTGAERPLGTRYSVLKLHVSKESYENWVAQQEKSLQDITNLSSFEEKTKPTSELQTMVWVMGHTLTDRDAKELAIIDNVFGEIKNL